jgi:glucosamine--fructose-6-phosphate aminotransferase (isomerizing)
MCGIIGYVGRQDAMPILMEGLHRLEYRGYDSAGLAIARSGALRLYKAQGKVRELERLLPKSLKGSPGIAHTRWATHGEPSERNAHPHTDSANRYAIVHNGIIENAAALRAQLTAKGVPFRSDTAGRLRPGSARRAAARDAGSSAPRQPRHPRHRRA